MKIEVIEGEKFFKIENHDQMRPFFMSIVSDSNHWLFISSNGGLSAGRGNSEYALFPYYTDDKITESADITGSKTIFQVQKEGKTHIWEPFSERYEGSYKTTRNLYKNEYGNKIIFEEINHDLELVFRYAWNSTNTYGFVKKSKVTNLANQPVTVTLLDGIQNIVPYGVGSETQMRASNLVDAYKRSELDTQSGMGIYALSAIIVDKAEPSEALKANVVWSLGLDNPTHLVSSLQLKKFRKGEEIKEETDVKAEKGAYFISKKITLQATEAKEWIIVADVNKNHAEIIALAEEIISQSDLYQTVCEKIDAGTQRLIELCASADALQMTADKFKDTRHFSNTMFNIMRGGIFDYNYQIEKWDFVAYLKKANKEVFKANETLLAELPETFSLFDLQKLEEKSQDDDFMRLAKEYLPLKFSRRHGDPSRPWNRFSINTRNEDGSKILDYEGNWRDIFQNWEALAHSYPEFIESMIYKFLNASTFDGYNPYRVTKDGFDWETIEPDDPWSYIGYWGDHQIIYLLKFLEFAEKHYPGKLQNILDKTHFVYANVPYKIKNYESILQNPKDTIDFDHDLDVKIREMRSKIGADGSLLSSANGEIYRVNFMEKILATVLAKLSNFIPEAGIWMNTQRPEWNDANNALVGNGVSMVTLYYLRRFLKFFQNVLATTDKQEVAISAELNQFFKGVLTTFDAHQSLLSGSINNQDRKRVLDGLGQAGSEYRETIYAQSFSGKKEILPLDQVKQLIEISLEYLEHSIRANKRTDDLYHAYNLMTIENDGVSISYLSEMLEGQVALLSSGYLSSPEALKVLDGLKASKLFRDDQFSYLLYPNKELPGFLQRNNIPQASFEKSELLKTLVKDDNKKIVEKDVRGGYHFNGNFKNAGDLAAGLDALAETNYTELIAQDKKLVLQIFEEIFNHKAFTGRSGTFFGYEGLGSIYWHMVSKLVLAVQETCLKAVEDQQSEEVIGRLLEHYYEINEGIGVHKSPELYGAFSTDPYSHTPGGKGAQQPGMTGQVKEDILSRFGELGVFVKEGQMYFNPCLLRKAELLTNTETFRYPNVEEQRKEIALNPQSLCFTYCQVPVVYQLAAENGLEVTETNGAKKSIEGLTLEASLSEEIFKRKNTVEQITVFIKENELR